jgi:hypothetical protein
MIQLDIPLGKIAKKLSRVSDEMVFYGKAGDKLYLFTIDPSQTMLVQIDAGIAMDEDFTAGIPVKELGETSKGVRYVLDFDQGVWKITYETATGMKVRKKVNGLEPSALNIDAILGEDWSMVNGEALFDYASITQALGEVDEESVVLRFTADKKMVVSASGLGKEVEVEAGVDDVVKPFEVRVLRSTLLSAVEALEPLAKSFRMGLSKSGILVLEPSVSKFYARVLLSPVAEA